MDLHLQYTGTAILFEYLTSGCDDGSLYAIIVMPILLNIVAVRISLLSRLKTENELVGYIVCFHSIVKVTECLKTRDINRCSKLELTNSQLG